MDDNKLRPEDEEHVDIIYKSLNDREAREAFWLIEQGLRGVMAANRDVHALWEAAKAELAKAKLRIEALEHENTEHDNTIVELRERIEDLRDSQP